MESRPETNYKLEWCEEELRALLEKLVEGDYHLTARAIYEHVAKSGVETDLNPDLKEEVPSMEEFIEEE